VLKDAKWNRKERKRKGRMKGDGGREVGMKKERNKNVLKK